MNIQITGNENDVCVTNNSTLQKLISTIDKQTQEVNRLNEKISRLYDTISAQREEIYKLSQRN